MQSFHRQRTEELFSTANESPNMVYELQQPTYGGINFVTFVIFFFNDTATTEIYTNLNTLSLHDAFPISSRRRHTRFLNVAGVQKSRMPSSACDRKSTRLNSSHIQKSRMPSSA